MQIPFSKYLWYCKLKRIKFLVRVEIVHTSALNYSNLYNETRNSCQSTFVGIFIYICYSGTVQTTFVLCLKVFKKWPAHLNYLNYKTRFLYICMSE